jgi:hypothetical protein
MTVVITRSQEALVTALICVVRVVDIRGMALRRSDEFKDFEGIGVVC